MSDRKGMSRRNFFKKSTTGITAAAAFPTIIPSSAFGANDRVNVAVIGIRGQGNSLKRGFAKLANVEIKTLCDIDANLAPERINDKALERGKDQFIQVVSCNTHNLAVLIDTIALGPEKEDNLAESRFVCMRRPSCGT